ncbi:Dihydropteroate synthase [Schizophyllum commune H4-8]|uniref:Dihydropteroate synthase n=1 Tax=Schizophyllum commune (strain H4-8 / FGSC 9210) TaxID=578458 RepID=UPI00215FDEFE|nr:Dihydropteroate synthase [Schizophyllum commune H4-8]KAI5891365.1 Dihydropteroate synthase [Schizophyllum commune H4-8]
MSDDVKNALDTVFIRKGFDLIAVNDLLLEVSLLSGSRWPPKQPERPTAQPILVSVSLPTDVVPAAVGDELTKSINYSAIASSLRNSVTADHAFANLEDILDHALRTLLAPESVLRPFITQIYVRLVQVKPPLHCASVGLEAVAKAGEPGLWTITDRRYFVRDLEVDAVIGVNQCEREEKQIVRLNASLEAGSAPGSVDFRSLTRRLYSALGQTEYLTLESFTNHAALEVLRDVRSSIPSPAVTVSAAKPYALVFAGSSEVVVRRSLSDFPTSSLSEERVTPKSSIHRAAIALGANIGDKFHNIEYALRLLEAAPRLGVDLEVEAPVVDIVDTSFLYESAPMYVTDQPSFINCACMIETNVPPVALLRLLKKIEEIVGRVPSVRNGPRAIDLDVVFYDDEVIDTRPPEDQGSLDNLQGHLVVPHPRLHERDFVLRPLADMIPDYVHPSFCKSISRMVSSLASTSSEPPLKRVIPIPRLPLTSPTEADEYGIAPVPETLTSWTYTPANPGRDAMLMATLNVTPDSFSDGAEHSQLSDALAYVDESVSAGASIIDIGGYSTRPGAAYVSPEEEAQRVVPVVQAIRAKDGPARDIPISVDTFRPDVAEAAIRAGANCINDVYAFMGADAYPFDDVGHKAKSDAVLVSMKDIARRYAVPVVLMHSRGEAGKNKDYSAYAYAGEGAETVEGVRVELGDIVERVVRGKGGVRRWLVIVDPGVGFSKTVQGNLALLRDGAQVVADVFIGPEGQRRRNPLAGYPVLVGTSRKSFLGSILEAGINARRTEGRERDWATAAAITCAVQQGALLIRAHDVQRMADVITVAKALT